MYAKTGGLKRAVGMPNQPKQPISSSSLTLFSPLLLPALYKTWPFVSRDCNYWNQFGERGNQKTNQNLIRDVHVCFCMCCFGPAHMLTSRKDLFWSQCHPLSLPLFVAHTHTHPPSHHPSFIPSDPHHPSILPSSVILTSSTPPTQTFWELSGGSSPLLWEIGKHSWGVVIEAY